MLGVHRVHGVHAVHRVGFFGAMFGVLRMNLER
jgi:hypothetical protein